MQKGRTHEHVGKVFENWPAGHQWNVSLLHYKSTQLMRAHVLINHHVTTRAVR